jgi:hypothetical protein
LKALGKQARHGPSSSAGSVLDAIVEGDAQRVEHLYRDSLTVQQRAALDSGQQGEAAQARKRLAQIPKIVITEMSSPYTLGEGLVQTVAANGGNAAVNRLLRKPPTHESALLDPFRLVLGGTKATQVAVPKLARGEKSFAKGEMGVLTWYFMLAERLPLAAALAAADGWGGDAFVGFERNGSTCARMDFAGKTPTDTTRMVSALQQWVAAVPGTPASVSRVGGAVRFDSCDPGTSVPAAQDDSEAAVNLLTDRTSIALAVVRSGAPKATARCLAGRMVQAYSLPQLSDPNFGKNDPTIQAQVQQFAADCR